MSRNIIFVTYCFIELEHRHENGPALGLRQFQLLLLQIKLSMAYICTICIKMFPCCQPVAAGSQFVLSNQTVRSLSI
jgi:hypothetical protein